jgi:hypothetical protein
LSWVKLAIALLKLANSYLTWARERELVSEGQDREIARETAAILAQSQFAKDTMQAVSALNDTQVDDVLKQLGAS